MYVCKYCTFFSCGSQGKALFAGYKYIESLRILFSFLKTNVRLVRFTFCGHSGLWHGPRNGQTAPVIGFCTFPPPSRLDSVLQDMVQVAAFPPIAPETVFLRNIVPFQQLIQRPFHRTFRQIRIPADGFDGGKAGAVCPVYPFQKVQIHQLCLMCQFCIRINLDSVFHTIAPFKLSIRSGF